MFIPRVSSPALSPTQQAAISDPLGNASLSLPYIPGWFDATATSLTAQRMYILRGYAPRPWVATAIQFYVGGADTADNAVHVGFFDSAGARLSTSGAVTGKLNAGTGLKSVTLAQTLSGVFYGALLVPTITTSLSLAAANANTPAFYGATVPNVGFAYQATQTTIPSSVGALTSATTVPRLGVAGA